MVSGCSLILIMPLELDESGTVSECLEGDRSSWQKRDSILDDVLPPPRVETLHSKSDECRTMGGLVSFFFCLKLALVLGASPLLPTAKPDAGEYGPRPLWFNYKEGRILVLFVRKHSLGKVMNNSYLSFHFNILQQLTLNLNFFRGRCLFAYNFMLAKF